MALKKLGVATEQVRYPEVSHGLSRGGRRDQRIDRLHNILRGFDRYLIGNGTTTQRGLTHRIVAA